MTDESSSGIKGREVEKVFSILCAPFTGWGLGRAGVHARISSSKNTAFIRRLLEGMQWVLCHTSAIARTFKRNKSL
jgi:hypothetical protein